MCAMTRTETGLGYGDFLRFGKLIMDRYGLYFSEGRRAQLEAGVQHAFSESSYETLAEYYDALMNDADAIEMERLINTVTVSESHFFRDVRQFDVLSAHVLPELIERRRAGRHLRIWSAGCAGGEEPYSLAIMLRAQLPDVDVWDITLLASDVNTDALARARRGVYSDWAFREAHARRWCAPYFDSQAGRYVLHPEVQNMVTYAHVNVATFELRSETIDLTEMDLILCRNVMIYLHDQTIQRLIDRLYDALADGGWLLVGQAEPSLSSFRRFETHTDPRAILYRRPMVHTSHDRRNADDKRNEGVVSQSDAFEQVRGLLKSGHAQEAYDVLMRWSAGRTGDAALQTLLGRVYAALEQWPEAERACRRALQVDKLALEAYFILAQALERQDKFSEALDMLKKVIFIDRQHILGHWHLANLYYRQGNMMQAHKSLDNARHLLEMKARHELLPGSMDLTVLRLQQMIAQRRQEWNMAT